MQYSDFIEINQEVMPIYTESHGRSLWEKFIPHEAFGQLLETLLKGLQDGGRPAWLQGPYGTGKTYAAYTMKHLFESDIDAVERFFAKHTKNLQHYWPRFQAARERGRIIVIYHDALSFSHGNSIAFFYALQESIKTALRAHHLHDAAEESLLENTRQRVRASNWDYVFEQHKTLFPEDPTAQDVLERLNSENPPLQLVLCVVDALLATGTVVRQNALDFRLWCESLVRANNLSGLIILCDEMTNCIQFSEHLNNLQTLASHTRGSNFLFVPITHKLISQSISDQNEVKKIRERFEHIQFHMPTPTAFHLIANCIQARSQQEQQWEYLCEQMKTKLGNVLSWLTAPAQKIDGADTLATLVPIHPYTAVLLAGISQSYLSSQRTLFSFIAADKGQAPSPLQRFLQKAWENEQPDFLTPDCLLDFFFLTENQDLGDFASTAPVLINQYKQRESSIGLPLAKRLFALITLLQILQRGRASKDIEAPRESIVRHCFYGTAKEEDIDTALEHLMEKHVLHCIDRGGDREFIAPDANIDHEKLKKYQAKYHSKSFADLYTELRIKDALTPHFSLDSLYKEQASLEFTTLDTLQKRRDLVFATHRQPYQVAFVICTCQNDSELFTLSSLCQSLTEAHKDVVFVALQKAFGEDNTQAVRQDLAETAYYAEINDVNRQHVAKQRWEETIKSWVTYALRGEMRIYAHCLQRPEGLMGDCKTGMKTCLHKIFFHGLHMHMRDLGTTLQIGKAGKGTARLAFEAGGTAQNRPLLTHLADLEAKPDDDSIKIIVQTIRAHFSKGEVPLTPLWEKLQRPPYGLYKSAAACLILAWALKPYVDSWYLFDESERSDMLNQESLCNLVDRLLNGKCKDKESLKTMAAHDKVFCAFVQSVCALPVERALFPAEAKREMNEWLKNSVGYPLCALQFLVDYAGERPQEGALATSISCLMQVLTAEEGRRAQATKKFYDLLHKNPLVESSLKSLLRRESLEAGLAKAALAESMPGISKAIQNGRLSALWFCQRLQRHLPQELWLWDKDAIVNTSPLIEADFQLSEALNDFLGTRHEHIEDSLLALRDKMTQESLPLCVLRIPELKSTVSWLDIFLEVVDNASPQQITRENMLTLAHTIRENKEILRHILWNDCTNILYMWANKRLKDVLSLEEISSILTEFGAEQRAEHGSLALDVSPDKLQKFLTSASSKVRGRQAARSFNTLFKELLGHTSPQAWSEAHTIPLPYVWPVEGEYVFSLFDPQLNPAPEVYERASIFLQNHADELKALNTPLHCARIFIARMYFTAHDSLESQLSPQRVLSTEAHAKELAQFLGDALGQNPLLWKQTEMRSITWQWITRQYAEYVKPRLQQWIAEQNNVSLRKTLAKALENPFFGLHIQKDVDS